MQKDEWLFSEDDEDGVAQLRNLGQDEHQGPKAGHAIVLDKTETNDLMRCYHSHKIYKVYDKILKIV